MPFSFITDMLIEQAASGERGERRSRPIVRHAGVSPFGVDTPPSPAVMEASRPIRYEATSKQSRRNCPDHFISGNTALA
jgi:hypothetical protein